MLTPTELVQQYQKLHGKQPGPQWLAANAKISMVDAESMLGQPTAPAPEQKELFTDAPQQSKTEQKK